MPGSGWANTATQATPKYPLNRGGIFLNLTASRADACSYKSGLFVGASKACDLFFCVGASEARDKLLAMNLLTEAAGLPIGLAPVGVIQIRDDDPLAGGGMQELAILDEDADVLGAPSGIEKYQIAWLQAPRRDGRTQSGLLAGIPW